MTEMRTNTFTGCGLRGVRGRKETLRVAIFGSCVSRDTCEHLPGAEVVAYVARQSMISTLHPVGANRFPSDKLESSFQARMFAGDQVADGVERITNANADVVLIDLVDERRGVWQFPDGSYLTNSIEAIRAGVEDWAPRGGARLIRFGTDEHYSLWVRALEKVMSEVIELPAIVILLDIAWAESYDGARVPQRLRSEAGRILRRAQRGARQLLRAVGRGNSLASAVHSFLNPSSTPAERLATEARNGNASFIRYRRAARVTLEGSVVHEQSGGVRYVIERSRDEVRTTPDHRWGPAPFHYRSTDYDSIAAEIARLTTNGDLL